MSRLIGTVLCVGLIRPAPGTWGSVAAVFLAWGLSVVANPLWILPAIVVAMGAGWWATAEMTRGAEDHDPSEIVVDELVGQWIALVPVMIGLTHAQVGFWQLWPGVVTAFVFFRLFDIWKPGPVGWADRQNTALGVMLDDVIAGVMAAIVGIAGAALAHGI